MPRPSSLGAAAVLRRPLRRQGRGGGARFQRRQTAVRLERGEGGVERRGAAPAPLHPPEHRAVQGEEALQRGAAAVLRRLGDDRVHARALLATGSSTTPSGSGAGTSRRWGGTMAASCWCSSTASAVKRAAMAKTPGTE